MTATRQDAGRRQSRDQRQQRYEATIGSAEHARRQVDPHRAAPPVPTTLSHAVITH